MGRRRFGASRYGRRLANPAKGATNTVWRTNSPTRGDTSVVGNAAAQELDGELCPLAFGRSRGGLLALSGDLQISAGLGQVATIRPITRANVHMAMK